MKRKYLFSLLGTCLLAACADIARQPVGYMAVIDVAAAMDNLSPLQLSELGSTVRYVPLETTDSCLIGNNPTLTMAKDYILVQSGNDCFAFDKKTGRFMAQIGHFGEDPQAYSNAFPYYNAQNGQVYFVRYPDKLQRYDLAGHYIGQATVPTPPAIPSSFAFADSALHQLGTTKLQRTLIAAVRRARHHPRHGALPLAPAPAHGHEGHCCPQYHRTGTGCHGLYPLP